MIGSEFFAALQEIIALVAAVQMRSKFKVAIQSSAWQDPDRFVSRSAQHELDKIQRSDQSIANAMKVLVVEDEPRLLRNLAKALREEGYAVDTADSGDDGLFKAENYTYDTIVLDVMLPVLDGWEILERLRKQKQTPVLMLTARDTPADRVRGLDTGADDYLIKPFDLSELLARIRALIRRTAGKAQSVIELGEVLIDTRARSATHRGQPVTMTAREYSILEYLALHRGKVISRTELYEHLFDENDDTLSNLLDVHVFAIRKKLGRDLISTRRGQGYCIET